MQNTYRATTPAAMTKGPMKKHRKRKRKAKNLRRYHATTVIDCRLRIKRSILSRSRQRRILSFLKSQGLNKQYIGSLMYYHQRKKSPDGSASNRESAKKRRGPLQKRALPIELKEALAPVINTRKGLAEEGTLRTQLSQGRQRAQRIQDREKNKSKRKAIRSDEG